MGLFDLPAPLLEAVNNMLGTFLPSALLLVLWGVFVGWLTMVVYRRLSNQERISALKAEQKVQQNLISGFDGEMEDLFPLIWRTLGLGFRQLGLAIGPALLATIPVLFVVAWVAGAFGYHGAEPGSMVSISATPPDSHIEWQPSALATAVEDGWELTWPADGESVSLTFGDAVLLSLPTVQNVPVIHKKQWWNSLIGNPIGYLADDQPIDKIDIGLPPQQYLPFGPDWLRGWMFLFFTVFLMSSLAFKFILKID